MERIKLNKLFIAVITLVMLLTISTNVLATDELKQPIDILVNQEETGTNEQLEQPTTPANTTTNTESTNGNTLPQTGDASDYAVFLLIGLCLVVSIYAYKKVRDYNRL